MPAIYVMQKTTQTNMVQSAVGTLKLLYPNANLDKLLEDIAKAKGTQWRILDEEKQYDILKEAVAQSQGNVAVTRKGNLEYETTAIQKDDLDKAMELIAAGWQQVSQFNGHVVFRREKVEGA